MQAHGFLNFLLLKLRKVGKTDLTNAPKTKSIHSIARQFK